MNCNICNELLKNSTEKHYLNCSDCLIATFLIERESLISQLRNLCDTLENSMFGKSLSRNILGIKKIK